MEGRAGAHANARRAERSRVERDGAAGLTPLSTTGRAGRRTERAARHTSA